MNNRKNVLEFGPGISTILMGRLIKKNKLQTKIVSVEHDLKWIEFVQSVVVQESMERFITIIHAPLMPCSLAVEQNLWYDTDILDNELSKHGLFDLLIVDGPPAMEQNKTKSRYPAFPYAHDILANEFAVYLDDVERTGESWISKKWSEQLNIDFAIKNGSLAHFVKGHSFNLTIV